MTDCIERAAQDCWHVWPSVGYLDQEFHTAGVAACWEGYTHAVEALEVTCSSAACQLRLCTRHSLAGLVSQAEVAAAAVVVAVVAVVAADMPADIGTAQHWECPAVEVGRTAVVAVGWHTGAYSGGHTASEPWPIVWHTD